jgi:serine/threonine protein kinase
MFATFNMAWETKYLKLTQLDHGMSGQAYMAIPHSSLTTAREQDGSPSEKVDRCLKDVVVVKYFLPRFDWSGGGLPKRITGEDEIRTLQEVAKRTCSLRARVAQMTDADFDRHSWIATQAVLGVVWKEFPYKEEVWLDLFSYHAFLQLLEAVRYLQSARAFPIAHLDIHKNNVLVDLRNSEVPGLPNLVLIDFDRAIVCDPSGLEQTRTKGGEATLERFRIDLLWYDISEVIFMLQHDYTKKKEMLVDFAPFISQVADWCTEQKNAREEGSRNFYPSQRLWLRYADSAIKRRNELLKEKHILEALGKKMGELWVESTQKLRDSLMRELGTMAS